MIPRFGFQDLGHHSPELDRDEPETSNPKPEIAGRARRFATRCEGRAARRTLQAAMRHWSSSSLAARCTAVGLESAMWQVIQIKFALSLNGYISCLIHFGCLVTIFSALQNRPPRRNRRRLRSKHLVYGFLSASPVSIFRSSRRSSRRAQAAGPWSMGIFIFAHAQRGGLQERVDYAGPRRVFRVVCSLKKPQGR